MPVKIYSKLAARRGKAALKIDPIIKVKRKPQYVTSQVDSVRDNMIYFPDLFLKNVTVLTMLHYEK